MDLSPFLAAVNIAATIIGTLYCFVLAVIIALRDIRGHFERIVFATCIAFALRSVALWLGGMWAWVGYYHIPGAFSIVNATLLALLPFALFSRLSRPLPLAILATGLATAMLMLTPDMIYGQTYYTDVGFTVLTFGPYINVYRIVLTILLIMPLVIYRTYMHRIHARNTQTIACTLLIGQSIYSSFVIMSTVLLPLFGYAQFTYYNTIVGIAVVATSFTIVLLRSYEKS